MIRLLGMHLRRFFLTSLLLVLPFHPGWAADGDEDGATKKNKLEATSPDGRFAFHDKAATADEGEAYQLIDKKSGKVLARVAEADIDPAPSARFFMKVLWKPDSQAFALTATLWKRGSYVAVFVRDGATFREVKVPELTAAIPEKIKAGREYPHISELNSESAKRWLKDGSLEVGIENIEDGNDGSVTANRTVILGIGKGDEAKILKSVINYTTKKY